jgi:hypothetical protein
MKQLVLVGLPGRRRPTSGASGLGRGVAIVDPTDDVPLFVRSRETVDRVFHAALVEALDSGADVVCIGEPNLTRDVRAPLSACPAVGRDSVACVMAESRRIRPTSECSGTQAIGVRDAASSRAPFPKDLRRSSAAMNPWPTRVRGDRAVGDARPIVTQRTVEVVPAPVSSEPLPVYLA